jgi:SOS-response transcriptional repressor LexA
MHPIQEKLLQLIDKQEIGNLALREIGTLIGDTLPQQVKHHLGQLEQKGFIVIDRLNDNISRADQDLKNSTLISIPILGSANCGPAQLYADQNIEGYLKVSERFVQRKAGLFAVKAQGNSLNRANIKGKSIESGDYVIIDTNERTPADGDYVLSVIDGMANLKKFRHDHQHQRIVLLSESTQSAHPIFIHEDDELMIGGKVIDVIKKFTN